MLAGTRSTLGAGSALLLLLPAAARAQYKKLQVLGDDGEPVPFASVSINGAPYRFADGSGLLRLSNVGQEVFAISVRRIGYRPWSGKLSLSDTSSTWTVRLQREGQLLPQVRIADGSRGGISIQLMKFYSHALGREQGVTGGVFIGPEEIERRDPTDLTQLLEGLSGIRMQRTARVRTPYADGGGNCQSRKMHLVIDGVHLDPKTVNNFDEFVSGSSIMAVEVYTRGSMIPADVPVLTSERGCGVVVVTTGSRR